MTRIYRCFHDQLCYSSAGSECIAVPQHYQKLSLLIGMTESNTVPRHDQNLLLFLDMIINYRCCSTRSESIVVPGHDKNLSLFLSMTRIYRCSSA
ncbi:hypothetical protein CDAR_57771 [Caerostris darwini]|uniref:Uncharacterized protein n=1 Tax=Caerostris darwini TaxID=1538125 RepID=A0AAV4P7U5_9ARAC|nr:hypothetical protein CDAR_57691 [Caerostris darwini]GIX93106.1 hypothetical protein CDAR_57771 [Caerostris darwini]